MAYIVWHSLVAYPGAQSAAAIKATASQLALVATGEGSNNWLGHTYGIIERYLPQEIAAMRKARQQHREFDFTAVNLVHVPVALISMLLLVGILAGAALRRRLDDITLLAGTAALALIGNAFLCGVLSGPHDRYGARLVWIATLVIVIAGVCREKARQDRHHRQADRLQPGRQDPVCVSRLLDRLPEHVSQEPVGRDRDDADGMGRPADRRR